MKEIQRPTSVPGWKNVESIANCLGDVRLDEHIKFIKSYAHGFRERAKEARAAGEEHLVLRFRQHADTFDILLVAMKETWRHVK